MYLSSFFVQKKRMGACTSSIPPNREEWLVTVKPERAHAFDSLYRGSVFARNDNVFTMMSTNTQVLNFNTNPWVLDIRNHIERPIGPAVVLEEKTV